MKKRAMIIGSVLALVGLVTAASARSIPGIVGHPGGSGNPGGSHEPKPNLKCPPGFYNCGDYCQKPPHLCE